MTGDRMTYELTIDDGQQEVCRTFQELHQAVAEAVLALCNEIKKEEKWFSITLSAERET